MVEQVPADTRTRIVEAAARFLRDQGPGAVTTRGVAQAAGVQAPAIYRLFGDKDGLLEAVAEHVMATFVADKASAVAAAAAADVDPVAELTDGWRRQVEFGLTNPALFALLSDPRRVAGSHAAQMGKAVLAARIHRVAAAGRLAVPEARAVALIQSAGVGVVTTILATPPAERDPELPDAVFQGTLAQILTDAPVAAASGHLAAAVALRAVTTELRQLSGPERLLLEEWLDRVIADPPIR
ncbi:TetR/AcrR family transcriptional regulator [Curtobacterium albidum]|uniref:TetR/AcrR family transcriptional regulator n=1 Tax=Curtobacterium citreum TaxID=2036 RepID=A0A850DS66_9MICO|nr:TetR/AcrR family transcriptional regulator [Curtobacterium albidum]NUU28416.1 TetR/AcrR family transcriptional regulator [Curtobacterium albidum]